MVLFKKIIIDKCCQIHCLMLANAFTIKLDLTIKCYQNFTSQKMKTNQVLKLDRDVVFQADEEQSQFCWNLNGRQAMIHLPENSLISPNFYFFTAWCTGKLSFVECRHSSQLRKSLWALCPVVSQPDISEINVCFLAPVIAGAALQSVSFILSTLICSSKKVLQLLSS